MNTYVIAYTVRLNSITQERVALNETLTQERVTLIEAFSAQLALRKWASARNPMYDAYSNIRIAEITRTSASVWSDLVPAKPPSSVWTIGGDIK